MADVSFIPAQGTQTTIWLLVSGGVVTNAIYVASTAPPVAVLNGQSVWQAVGGAWIGWTLSGGIFTQPADQVSSTGPRGGPFVPLPAATATAVSAVA